MLATCEPDLKNKSEIRFTDKAIETSRTIRNMLHIIYGHNLLVPTESFHKTVKSGYLRAGTNALQLFRLENSHSVEPCVNAISVRCWSARQSEDADDESEGGASCFYSLGRTGIAEDGVSICLPWIEIYHSAIPPQYAYKLMRAARKGRRFLRS